MRKFTLILYTDKWKQKLEFVRKYGDNIVNIQFKFTVVSSIEDVKSVLDHTPNVEKMFFDLEVIRSENDQIVEEVSSDCVAVELNDKQCENVVADGDRKPEFLRLKNLEIAFCDPIVIKLVEYLWNCDQLEKLFLNLYVQFFKIIPEFVFKQQKLKELDIDSFGGGFFNEPFDKSVLQNIKFRLKKLNLQLHVAFSEGFAEFCNTQSELEELSVICRKIDKESFQHILKVCKKLKIVTLNALRLKRYANDALADCNVISESVEQLHTKCYFTKSPNLEKFMMMFPNVQTISAYYMTESDYEGFKNLKKLSKIKTGMLKCDTIFNVEIPNLKILVIKSLEYSGSTEFWESFANCYSNLETLIISEIRDSLITKIEISALLKSLTQLEKLKEFSISFKTKNNKKDDKFFISLKIIENIKPEIKMSSYCADNFKDDLRFLQDKHPNSEVHVI